MDEQSSPEDVPDEPDEPLLLEDEPPLTVLPTPLELSPGIVAAVLVELLAEAEAEAELAPASMSVPVASKLAMMVLLSPLMTELLVPEMLS